MLNIKGLPSVQWALDVFSLGQDGVWGRICAVCVFVLICMLTCMHISISYITLPWTIHLPGVGELVGKHASRGDAADAARWG